MKTTKYLTGFLGISMFMFGFLKFFDPFKSWYMTQVVASELPLQSLSYWAGQIGEMAAGAVLLWVLWRGFTSGKMLFYLAHAVIVVMMLVALYVHQHPAVPADVLPMKIKPPFIPATFALLALVNGYMARKHAVR